MIPYLIRKSRNLLILPVAPRGLSASAEQKGRCEVEDILVGRRCLPAPTGSGVGHLRNQIFLKTAEDDAEYRNGEEGVRSNFTAHSKAGRSLRPRGNWKDA